MTRYCFLLLLGLVSFNTLADTPMQTPRGTSLDPVKAQAAEEVHALLSLAEAEGTLFHLLVAEFALHRDQPKIAMHNYLQIMKETRDPQLAKRATQIALFINDQKSGLEAATRWREVAPDELEAHQAYAMFLLNARAKEQALRALLDIGEQWYEPAGHGYRVVAEILIRQHDGKYRLEMMRKVVLHTNENPYALAAMAQVAVSVQKIAQAINLVEHALGIKPDVARHRILLASIQYFQGKLTLALNTLATHLNAYPEANKVRMVYGRYLADAKRHDEALAQFRAVVAVEPNSDGAHYALGLLLLRTKQPRQARLHFEKLIKLGKQREVAYYYLGQAREAQEELAQALIAYRQVSRGEFYLKAQIRTALIYARQGQNRQALDHLDSVRRRSVEDDVRLYRVKAEIYVKALQFAAAIKVYNQALEVYPKNNDLLYARAMVWGYTQRYDILERDLRVLLSRDPKNADALNALGYTLADKTQRYQEAYELVKSAYELRPDSHYILDSMGWVLYRIGRYEEAVEYLQKALSIKPDAEIAAHLGEVFWALGDKERAHKVWNTALEQTPNNKQLLEVIRRFRQ